jgi:hypothetical protein
MAAVSRLLGIGGGRYAWSASECRRLTGSNAIEAVRTPRYSQENSNHAGSNDTSTAERPDSRQGSNGYGTAGRDVIHTDSGVWNS